MGSKTKTKDGYPVIKGYFQFTTLQDKREHLDEWIKWFKSKGIKTKVVKRKKMFMLYRKGVDACA